MSLNERSVPMGTYQEALSIREQVYQLASGVGTDFSYHTLICEHANNAFWAIQVALHQCYQYEFQLSLGLNLKLIGNVHYYQFRCQLENVFQQFIREKFMIDTVDQWDNSRSINNFIDYLETVILSHPSSQHPLFTQFVPEYATKENLRFLIAQESPPRFDDLVSMIQIGNPIQMKMELARNYWDEMGNGNPCDAHSVLFEKVLTYFGITEMYVMKNILLQSMIFDNISSLLAIYRENYMHAIGFLAAAEYCEPARFSNFVKGCQRLGVGEDELVYHRLHSDIDVDHANGWFQNVIKPLVESDAQMANNVLEGVLLKLNVTQYFFDSMFNKIMSMKQAPEGA